MSTELVIDIGHSRVKWARLVDGAIDPRSIGRAATDRPDALHAALDELDCRRALLSGQSRPESVARIAERLTRRGARVDIITTGDRPMPVPAAYKSLGCDRWLALQKPRLESPGAFVVVDSGTAITVDLVDSGGRHRGGWIMAGIEAARSGLFARAPGLNRPLPEAGDVERPARDTGRALARGGLLLAAGGIERAIRAAEQAVDDQVSLWLTGGDAAELVSHLERTARHDQHLVLHGLAMAMQAK
ncbi:type III pantothenate kinase [Wenzhouxiangella sp. EGI_FJ10409]|uniref:type III pantothenate kinase n=1 Tax=Wenzhouxiangella sp. EGI_FJ10409 TaxID=3243767 RepID=UPI0035D56DCC